MNHYSRAINGPVISGTPDRDELPNDEHRSSVPWRPPLSRGWVRAFVLVLAATIGLRLVTMAAVPLIPQEAYYWMYSQHPAPGYFDHPPMVAWMIGLGTAVFGHTEFGVRIVGNLLMLGASLLMYRFGRAWFGRAAGLLSALLLQLLPVYYGVGFIATMDPALIFFWMLCLVGLTAALREERPWGWYVAGTASGLALMSKYTGLFLLAGAALAVVVYRPWRRHLLTAHPYIAFLIAVAIFSPTIIWNARHDWASFRFQFLERWDPEPLSVGRPLGFVMMQLLVATPMVLWGCGVFVARVLRMRRRLMTPRSIVVLSFSVPLFLVMAYKSLRYSVNINWTVPAFLSLFPAVSAWLVARTRRLSTARDRRLWARRIAWTAVPCILVNLLVAVYLLALQPRLQWVLAFGPWRELADIVEEHEDRLEQESGKEPLIIADGKYRLASVLAFYRRPLEQDVDTTRYTTSQWILGGQGLAYPYWADRNRWRGSDCLYVDDTEEGSIAKLREYFESVEPVNDPRLQTIGRQRYAIAVCRKLRLPQ